MRDDRRREEVKHCNTSGKMTLPCSQTRLFSPVDSLANANVGMLTIIMLSYAKTQMLGTFIRGVSMRVLADGLCSYKPALHVIQIMTT